MKRLILLSPILFMFFGNANSQTLSQTQMRNARATGYAVVAARNPGVSFSILVVPWDGVNSLEYNANHQINFGWHAQAAVKGNFFSQPFDGNDFSEYSSVVLSQAEFDQYKAQGTQWWIICSTLSPFSNISGTTYWNGNVGIGTTSPDLKLTVNGKIKAEEVQVVVNVADYVFHPDYKLKTLEEVESYIKEHSHLPGVPNKAEVDANGFQVGQMTNKVLEKVEELTLYIIELKKQNDELRARLERLEKM